VIREFESFSGSKHDAIITVREEPSWFDRLLGRRSCTIRYRGSRATWFKYPSGIEPDVEVRSFLLQIWRSETGGWKRRGR
jgi:hypothetical protein